MTGGRNPVSIAEYAGIRIAILPLGEIAGNYKLIKRKRWIFVNDNIPTDSPLFQVIVAHRTRPTPQERKLCLYQKQNIASNSGNRT